MTDQLSVNNDLNDLDHFHSLPYLHHPLFVFMTDAAASGSVDKSVQVKLVLLGASFGWPLGDCCALLAQQSFLLRFY